MIDAFERASVSDLQYGMIVGLRASLLVACFLLPLRTAAAQEKAPMLLQHTEQVRQLDEGRGHLFDLRLAAADSLFRELAETEDGAPAAYLHLATTSLLRALFRGRERDFERFFARVEALSQALDDAPAGPWRSYFRAEQHFRTTVVLAEQGQRMRAAWAARSAHRGYQRAIADSASFYEVYQGLGLLHFSIGALPSRYRRLMHLIGYEGSVDQGIRELRLAGQRGRYTEQTAPLLLAFMRASLEDRTGPARETMERLYRRRPESALFGYLYGRMLLADRQASQAESVLLAVRERMGQPDYFYVDFVEYYLGDAYFRQNRFAEAASMLRRFLARHEGKARKAEAALKLGLALEMEGSSDARTFYERVDSYAGEGDGVRRRRAGQRLERPMTEAERTLLRGRNYYDGGQYERAEPLLRSVYESADLPLEQRNEASYRLGRLYQALGREEEALKHYRYAVQHRADDRAKWAPWSQYYIGVIHRDHGRTAAAEDAFRAVLAYEAPFDYRQGLEQRTELALERMQQGE